MRREGFTLPELMISMAILGILSMFLSDMLVQQNKAYTVVDQVSEVQNNSAAIATLLEHDARETALLAPEAAAVCGVDSNTASDVLYLTDGAAMNFANEIRYDLGGLVASSNPSLSGTSAVLDVDDVTVDGDPFYDTDGDANPDSDFQIGSGVIVVDRANPDRGAACGVVTAVTLGTDRITVDFSQGSSGLLARNASHNAPDHVAVPATVYRVNNNLQLLRNSLVLAEDVEDLQFSLFYDANDDGVIAAAENPGAYSGPQYVPRNEDNRDLSEIRIAFVVRSRAPDPALPDASFQALENRNPVAGTDGFRRRVHVANVRPRNVGHRVD